MRPLLFAAAFMVLTFPACGPSTPDDSSVLETPIESSPLHESPPEVAALPDTQPATEANEEASEESGEEADKVVTKRISVGDNAPNFRLPDQTGKQRTLDDLLVEGNVALVFYRSADW